MLDPALLPLEYHDSAAKLDKKNNGFQFSHLIFQTHLKVKPQEFSWPFLLVSCNNCLLNQVDCNRLWISNPPTNNAFNAELIIQMPLIIFDNKLT